MPTNGPANPMPAPVLVLGLGNPLMRDDGVGLEMLRRLHTGHQAWSDQVEFLDGGTQGLVLLGAIGGRRSLVILDAIRTGAPAGTPHVLRGEEVHAFHHTRGSSAHETDAREVLQTAELTGDYPRSIALVGLEPHDTTTGIGLSPVLLQNLDDALGKARHIVEAALADLGNQEGEHHVSGGSRTNHTG